MKTVLDDEIRRLEEDLLALKRARKVLLRRSPEKEEEAEEDQDSDADEDGEEGEEPGAEVDAQKSVAQMMVERMAERRWTTPAYEALEQAGGLGLSIDELIKNVEERGFPVPKQRNTILKFIRRGRENGRIWMPVKGRYRARPEPA